MPADSVGAVGLQEAAPLLADDAAALDGASPNSTAATAAALRLRTAGGGGGQRLPSGGQRSRRAHIRDILAACKEDLARLERGAALETAASERQVRLAQESLSSGLAFSSGGSLASAQSSSSLPARFMPPMRRPPSDATVAGLSANARTGNGHAATQPQRMSPAAAGVARRRPEPGELVDVPPSGVLLASKKQLSTSLTALGSAIANAPEGHVIQPQVTGPLIIEQEPFDETVFDEVAVLMESLARDNTVLECDLRDYASALEASMREAVRLRVEAGRMETACNQLGQLQEVLSRERQALSHLRDENLRLLERNREITLVVEQAMGANDDEDNLALLEELSAENAALRELLRLTYPGASSHLAAVSVSPPATSSCLSDAEAVEAPAAGKPTASLVWPQSAQTAGMKAL
eukprot:TRINITY_DN53359_c0_g1_i1.p1 TRINITY_DN53359_c0_g1~~TRINITY_DN53359_c0_g1_i1.p1  ORF type:complete len:408 (+),score=96.87 TRINITY_DN53359_c0_g1_i1:291-1514(+)